MGKYDPLAAHLRAAGRPCRMTFAAIEELVGVLPASARKHRTWWANDRSHVQAAAWLNAGRVVQSFDLRLEGVEFS